MKLQCFPRGGGCRSFRGCLCSQQRGQHIGPQNLSCVRASQVFIESSVPGAAHRRGAGCTHSVREGGVAVMVARSGRYRHVREVSEGPLRAASHTKQRRPSSVWAYEWDAGGAPGSQAPAPAPGQQETGGDQVPPVGWQPGRCPSFSSLPLTPVCLSFRQLMAQEPLEKLGFGDLMDGKADKH